MGCVYSRSEFESPNTRIFQVWNVDGDGRNVKPGKIEVTESQLILYQRGDITVRWPLRSLRRYGFDAELFSFECGRRCPTGPGVYAFKCRRAEALFNILQECIQNSGGGAGNISISAIDEQISLTSSVALNHNANAFTPNGTVVSSIAQESTSRQNPTVDSAGYLEPITANSHSSQCPFNPSRNNNGTAASSPGGFVCFHSMGSEGMAIEWTSNSIRQSSNTFASCCSLGSCRRSSNHHYVNKDVMEQTSSTLPSGVCLVHQYVNAAVIAADPTKKCCTSSRCLNQNDSTYVNSSVASSLGLSSGHLPCPAGCCAMNCMHCVDINTNYAKLDDLLKQEHSVKRQKEQQHMYVNVKPEVSNPTNSIKCISGRSSPTDFLHKDNVTSPFGSSAKGQHSHFYANLGSPSSVVSADTSRELARSVSQVNYAVLDLDKNEAGNAMCGSPVSTTAVGNSLPSSPIRTPEGYAQIDFDKTVALSNSAIPCPSNDESIRKTRHNAINPSSSVPS